MTLRITLRTGSLADVRGDTLEGLEPLPVPTRPLPSIEEARREGTLVLLAEDHPVNRKVLTLQLNLAGIQVECAENGDKALEMFRRGRYGLVFTDLHMPGLDGRQLTAAIRAHERENGVPRTPVIALTANVLSGEAERCLAAGMDDYLGKPVTIGQLSQKLERWLQPLPK
jgi:CheY-like chemotaxis protein